MAFKATHAVVVNGALGTRLMRIQDVLLTEEQYEAGSFTTFDECSEQGVAITPLEIIGTGAVVLPASNASGD